MEDFSHMNVNIALDKHQGQIFLLWSMLMMCIYSILSELAALDLLSLCFLLMPKILLWN